jgi:hypothetical protein
MELLPILIAIIIFCIVVWAIGLLPLPKSPLPLKVILYVVAAAVLCIYLLRYI